MKHKISSVGLLIFVAVKKAGRNSWNWLRGLLLLGILPLQLALLLLLLYRVLPVPYTPLMAIRKQEKPGLELKKDWISLDEIAIKNRRVVITSEDPRFFEHMGFDFDQIQRAVEKTVDEGKKLRGASTISQQTTKNLFLWPARSWIRKGLEVPLTLGMEWLWPKQRIFEVYINIIEMGDGVFGIEAASRQYFKKPAAKLNEKEMALIVACFPNPRIYHPNAPTPYIRWKQRWILKYLPYTKWPE